jgi:hypothetical protein
MILNIPPHDLKTANMKSQNVMKLCSIYSNKVELTVTESVSLELQ